MSSSNCLNVIRITYSYAAAAVTQAPTMPSSSSCGVLVNTPVISSNVSVNPMPSITNIKLYETAVVPNQLKSGG